MTKIYKMLLRNLVAFSLLLLFSAVAFSQNNVEYFSKEDSSKIAEKTRTKILDNKIHYGLIAGTSVIAGSGKSFFSNVYTAPYMDYAVNPKLTVRAGFLFSNYNFVFNPSNSENAGSIPKSLTQSSVFLEGRYKLNDDLTLFGSGYFSVNKLQGQDNYSQSQFDRKGYSLGLDYKVANNSHISIEFNFNKKPDQFLNPYFEFPGSGNISR